MARAGPDRPRRAATAIVLAAGISLLAAGCGAGHERAGATAASAGAPPVVHDPARARLLRSPQVRHWQDQQRFAHDAREFLRTASSIPPVEREQRADALQAQITERERTRELSAGEAMLLRVALVQALPGSDAEQARRLAALAEGYRKDAERREAAWIASQRSDPRMQQYKARERIVVAEVMAMTAIPGGLTRDQYLRQRLQQERERAWGKGG